MEAGRSFSIEVYEQGIKKLESRWLYIDELVNDMVEDNAFKQHQELIELLDYLRKSTNRIKLGIIGTEPAIDYPLGASNFINCSEPNLLYNYRLQPALFVLGRAIAELKEVIKDLYEQYALVAMEAEYHELSYHWDLIDNWTSETKD